jgi:hypothetical protein
LAPRLFEYIKDWYIRISEKGLSDQAFFVWGENAKGGFGEGCFYLEIDWDCLGEGTRGVPVRWALDLFEV